jgi:hypothetical protein
MEVRSGLALFSASHPASGGLLTIFGVPWLVDKSSLPLPLNFLGSMSSWEQIPRDTGFEGK